MSSEQARVENGALAPPAAPLHVRRLGIARAAWAALFTLSLGAYALALPRIYETARTVCAGPECAQWRLSPDGASALLDAGLPVDLYAALTLGLRVLSASAFFVLAALIFRQKSDERLPLWLSLFLLLQAPGSDVGALRLALPPLALLGTLQEYLATALLVPLFYLFPDGRWVPRWGRVPALLWVVLQFFYYFLPDSPLSGDSWPVLLQGTLFLGCFGSAAFAQVYRYRRVAGPAERQQTKWVVAGLTAAILGSVVLALIEAAPAPVLVRELAGTLVDPVFLVLPLSVGIAILRYRLWDIDIIVNRALVYGALTATIAGVYALVVGGLGALLQARGSPLLALLGAGTIAVLFAPLRDRLQRGVNRLMYGERGDPYGVLSRLGRQLEGALAPDGVLHTVAHTVKDALKLPYVAIALRDGDEFTINAAAGVPTTGPLSLPLVHRGETVGRLLLGHRAGERSLSTADRRLLDDIARQAGVAAHAVRLTADLRSSNEELRAARGRLVTAREEERRRLRRDLHDGLGPQLAGFTLRLDAARNLLRRDPDTADALLGDLSGRAQAAVDDIRRLVYALRPPALDDLGLVAALRQHAEQYAHTGLWVTVQAPESLPSLPAAAEVVAYRIAQEALANAARHSGAATCAVRIALKDALCLEITDDGRGIEVGRRAGVGLASMRERAEELGGSFAIESAPNAGTTVRVRLPLSGSAGDT